MKSVACCLLPRHGGGGRVARGEVVQLLEGLVQLPRKELHTLFDDAQARGLVAQFVLLSQPLLQSRGRSSAKTK